jgi:phosphotransferase system HPr (HPr) family protein
MPENYEKTITLAGDLHARPAGQLAVAAAAFSATVQLIVAGGAGGGARGGGAGGQADAKSVLAVMQLGASSGRQVTVRAVGADAEKAVETLIGILSAVSKVGD